MQIPVVSLQQIHKSYFGRAVFSGLDLILEPGNFYALLGKNGSGKSTLIRILAHREIVESGSGIVLGVDLDHDFVHIGNKIAFVSEAAYFPPDMKIRELMELHSINFENWNQLEAEKLLKGFNLDSKKCTGELSRGQLVQAGLVLALAYSPELILLDEVTAVLDAGARGFLMGELSKRVHSGATVLLATNIVSEVQNIANALILVGDRKVKMNVSTEEISSEFVKLLKKSDHDIFRKDSCIEVGLAGREPIYLITRSDFNHESVPTNLISDYPITPEEIFLYLTRIRD